MGSTVNFYNACFGTVLVWDWDFGLSAFPPTALGEGPHTVVYDSPGLKTVSLYVNRAAGTDNEIKVDYINVSPSPWTSDFTWGLVPYAPSALHAKAIDNSTITVDWTDNAFNELGFKIERSLDGTLFSQVGFAPMDATAYRNSPLLSGTQYWYRIRSYNTFGDSSYSNTSFATTY